VSRGPRRNSTGVKAKRHRAELNGSLGALPAQDLDATNLFELALDAFFEDVTFTKATDDYDVAQRLPFHRERREELATDVIDDFAEDGLEE
tara:strand:+ start:356 stop:628 length:273 start_codon:yes stop_codon:yes gene_type:complete